METIMVSMSALLLFAGMSLVFVLVNLIDVHKLKSKYLNLKDQLYHFGVLYHPDIIIIVGSGLASYFIYKLSQGN
jgi:hypothetical protein